MRGLPFKASQGDVHEFFRPLQPINVQILMDDTGRASGEADVEFATHDEAVRAMNKDKANMRKCSKPFHNCLPILSLNFRTPLHRTIPRIGTIFTDATSERSSTPYASTLSSSPVSFQPSHSGSSSSSTADDAALWRYEILPLASRQCF